MTDVQGRCPACGGSSLFLGEGGHVTCSRIDCPNPCAAEDLLHGGEAALTQLLGNNRAAGVVAHTLHFHGHSLADVRRMTDDQLLAVPGIGQTSLARIRAAFPAPELASTITVEAEGVRAVKRAEAAEATVARVRAEAARIRAVTPTWGPVADLIDAALAGTSEGPTPEPRLLDCGWCYEEQGEEVHPHPECPIGARRGPIVGTARITVYVQAAGGGLDWLNRHAADVSRRKGVDGA